MLPDGTYDAIVVDATVADADPESAHGPTLSLELTVLAGGHKGEVVAVAGPTSGRDPIDLLGIPATITVADGSPSVRLEP